MRILTAVVLAAVLNTPIAATAAELAVPPARTKAVIHHIRHHKLVRVIRTHRGYYFYQWGWRYGPSGASWVGSRFRLVGWSELPPWAVAYSAIPRAR